MRSGWRLAAAFGCSLVLHLLLVLAVQQPVRPLEAVSHALHVLLVPLATPAPPPAAPPPPVPRDKGPEAKPPPQAKAKRASPAKSPAVPSPQPLPDLRPPEVTASLVSMPRIVPPSELGDASGYYPSEGLTRAPRLAGRLPVRYPRRAFEAKRQGVVVLQVMIDEKGRVTEALPVLTEHDELVEAALAGVRRARFQPGELGGRAVPVRAYLAVNFVIE